MGSNRATDAPYVVTYNGGAQTFSINRKRPMIYRLGWLGFQREGTKSLIC